MKLFFIVHELFGWIVFFSFYRFQRPTIRQASAIWLIRLRLPVRGAKICVIDGKVLRVCWHWQNKKANNFSFSGSSRFFHKFFISFLLQLTQVITGRAFDVVMWTAEHNGNGVKGKENKVRVPSVRRERLAHFQRLRHWFIHRQPRNTTKRLWCASGMCDWKGAQSSAGLSKHLSQFFGSCRSDQFNLSERYARRSVHCEPFFPRALSADTERNKGGK